MADSREYVTHPEELGSINISEDVVSAIAAAAASEVDGVSGLVYGTSTNVHEMLSRKNISKGVKLDIGEDSVAIDVFIMVRFGSPIADIAKNVQDAVAAAVENMTELKVSRVNVHVGGVSFDKAE
jgi:uncharacterized alkaline shock family protein YloU